LRSNKTECGIDQELVEAAAQALGRTQQMAAALFYVKYVMAAILEIKRHIENLTLSINVYLLNEQSCQISPRSDLKRGSLRLLLEEVTPKKTR